jgi:hypothetical protein
VPRPVKLLSIGFAVCVLAAVAILFALRDDGQEVVADTPRRSDAVTTVTHDAALPEEPIRRPAPRAAIPRERPLPTRPAPTTDTWSRTVPGQDADVDDEPIPVDDRGLPMVSVTKPEVAEANFVIEPLVRECISQSGFTGSGTAVLRLTIGRQREKESTTSVQDTGFDEEGTTLGTEEKLVECLHKTALQMTFPKTQTGGAIWATRMVVIEDGQLKEHSVIDIGRLWNQYKN